MAFQPEVNNYETGVYQWEVTDPVQGGVGGVDNIPILQLANRTKYLKTHVDVLESKICSMLTNNTFTPTGTYSDITALTYTTPNDGVTRKYLFTFKTLASAIAAPGISIFCRLYNNTTSTVLDNSGVFKNNAGTLEINESIVLISLVTLAPNTVIKVQGVSTAGTTPLIFSSSFLIEEK